MSYIDCHSPFPIGLFAKEEAEEEEEYSQAGILNKLSNWKYHFIL